MKKTIIALIPALIVQIGLLFIGKIRDGQEFVVWLLIAILVVGGIMSGIFVNNYLRRTKPGKNGFFYGFIAFLVFVGYVFTFFFTGCLLTVMAGN